jgi:hypothetical protein
MAEIGLAASIIAVIQITTSVTKQAYEYGQSVKNATKDIAKIQGQVKDVESILVKLKDLVDRATKERESLDSWPTLVAINKPSGALEKCRLAMTTLCTELTPAEGLAKYKQRDSWPLKKKRIDQVLQNIMAQKDIFIALLSVEHM